MDPVQRHKATLTASDTPRTAMLKAYDQIEQERRFIPPYGIGYRVRLAEEPSVPGTIIALGDDPRWPFEVQWDNGHYSAHSANELTSVEIRSDAQ